MKSFILFFMICLGFIFKTAAQTKPGYDSVLAKKLDADPYGMKKYVLVILTTGPADIKEKKVVDSLFAGHMKNIGRLADQGKLVVAGPFGKNDLSYRGVFVFNTSSIDDTKAMVATDPAVKAGLLSALYLNWYCSAALMEVNSIHEKIQKSSF